MPRREPRWPFRILEPVQALPNGKLLHRRVWVLVPHLPGEAVFQPLEITAGASTVTTEPIAVHVESLLPEGLDTLEIKDIAEAVELLPEQKQRQQHRFILFSAVGALLVLALAVKLARRPKKVVVLAPHEIAFQALENLPDDALERVQALTGILLAFIGGRFKVATAGKTINEILPFFPKKILLGRRGPLERFLINGEQFRFSNKVPAGFPEEMEKFIRSFVEEMKEEPCD